MSNKRTFIAIILFMIGLLGMAGAGLVSLPGLAEKRIASLLVGLGYPNNRIGDVKAGLSKVSASHIYLDSHGFNTIEHIDLTLNWYRFLTQKEVSIVHIKGVTLLFPDISDIRRSALKAGSRAAGLEKFPPEIVFEDMVLDIATPIEDLRFVADISLNQDAQGRRMIKGSVRADQYALSLDSRWSGVFDPEAADTFELEGEIEGLRLHTPYLSVTRAAGWANIGFPRPARGSSASPLSLPLSFPDFYGQIQAGSGRIFGLPLQNLSLLLEQKKGQSTALFQAASAGAPSVRLIADYKRSVSARAQDSNLIEQTKTLGEFEDRRPVYETAFQALLEAPEIGHLSRLTRPPAAHAAADDDDDSGDVFRPAIASTLRFEDAAGRTVKGLKLLADFLPEKKFANGPVPFQLNILTTEEEELGGGHFLIYPDNLDLRGKINVDPVFAAGMTGLFPALEPAMDKDLLSLNVNLKQLAKDTALKEKEEG